MLAATYQWQRWTTGTTRTFVQALARIYTRLPAPATGIDYSAAELLAYMPFIVVWMEPASFKYDLEGMSDPADYQPYGTLGAFITWQSDQDWGDIDDDALNKFGNILKRSVSEPGLIDLVGNATYLTPNRFVFGGLQDNPPFEMPDIPKVLTGWLFAEWDARGMR